MKPFEETLRAFLQDAPYRMEGASTAAVAALLDRPAPADAELPALFAPAADPLLEELAARAAALTRRRFGRTIQLYAPLYLSNACVNRCAYCGFSRERDIPRITLGREELRAEAARLAASGFRHVLLVSGEDRTALGPARLEQTLAELGRTFASISLEVYPMREDEYRRMAAAGADGVALYQEVYDPELYRRHHPAGPKSSWSGRLAAIEEAGRAGLRTLGIGALLGLGEWRAEAAALALHGRYLTRRFWRSRIAVSFPRLRPVPGGYAPPRLPSERDLVHMLCATRLLLPDAEIVLSTREPAPLRDRLLALGVTRISAGSRTAPGGYANNDISGAGQFAPEDVRSPAEVAAAIAASGFEPVWKDQDRALAGPWPEET